jgi:hypothetical protein
MNIDEVTQIMQARRSSIDNTLDLKLSMVSLEYTIVIIESALLMRFASVKGKLRPNKPALDYLRMRNPKIP